MAVTFGEVASSTDLGFRRVTPHRTRKSTAMATVNKEKKLHKQASFAVGSKEDGFGSRGSTKQR